MKEKCKCRTTPAHTPYADSKKEETKRRATQMDACRRPRGRRQLTHRPPHTTLARSPAPGLHTDWRALLPPHAPAGRASTSPPIAPRLRHILSHTLRLARHAECRMAALALGGKACPALKHLAWASVSLSTHCVHGSRTSGNLTHYGEESTLWPPAPSSPRPASSLPLSTHMRDKLPKGTPADTCPHSFTPPATHQGKNLRTSSQALQEACCLLRHALLSPRPLLGRKRPETLPCISRHADEHAIHPLHAHAPADQPRFRTRPGTSRHVDVPAFQFMPLPAAFSYARLGTSHV